MASSAGVVYYELRRGTMIGQSIDNCTCNHARNLQLYTPCTLVVFTCSFQAIDFKISRQIWGLFWRRWMPRTLPSLWTMRQCIAAHFVRTFLFSFCLHIQSFPQPYQNDTIQRLTAIPHGQSIAEHRLSVLHDLASTNIENQHTLSGEKITHVYSCNAIPVHAQILCLGRYCLLMAILKYM